MRLDQITGKGSGLPSRYVFYGVPSIGKTSLAAMAPKPLFVTIGGETGLQTLIDAGQLPETPHFPESVQDWATFLALMRTLIDEDHDNRTLVIDSIDNSQEQCYTAVSNRDFNGDRSRTKWLNYNAGPISAVTEWRGMLTMLDELRERRKMAIVLIAHSAVVTFKNPEGADFDRYQPTLDKGIWNVTKDWSDAVFFMNFETFVAEDDPKKKGKAKGGQTRILYTQNHAAFDAKNRFGLDAEIPLGNSPQEAWSNLSSALQTAKNSNGKAA